MRSRAIVSIVSNYSDMPVLRLSIRDESIGTSTRSLKTNAAVAESKPG